MAQLMWTCCIMSASNAMECGLTEFLCGPSLDLPFELVRINVLFLDCHDGDV